MNIFEENIDLIIALKEGDMRAYEVLFKKYHAKTVTWARCFLRDYESAEDVAQNVFLKVWINRENISENYDIDHYIFILARNEAFDIIKKRNSQKQFEKNALAYNIETSYTNNEEHNISEIKIIINRIVDKMPEKRKQVFILSRENWLTNEEISKRLNISKRTVEKHLNLALKEIRKVFGDFFHFFLFF